MKEKFKKYVDMNLFDEKQLYEIKLGLKKNIDVSVYAKPEFNDIEMSYIRGTLLKGFNPKDLIGKVEFRLLALFADLKTLGLDIENYIYESELSLRTLKAETLSKKAEEIIKNKGFDINDFDKSFIEEIKISILKGIDLTPYISKGFNYKQLREIKNGLEEGLDVSIYAKEEFNHMQMEEIKLGLKYDIDINIYANSNFNSFQMFCIRMALKKGFNPKDLIGKVKFDLLPLFSEINNLGLNVFDYIDRDEKDLEEIINKSTNIKAKELIKNNGYNTNEIDNNLINIIRLSILEGIDLTPYLSKKFNYFQLEEIKKGLEDNLNVSLYAYKEFDGNQMEEIREALLEGIFKRKDYFITKIVNGEIKYIPKDF